VVSAPDYCLKIPGLNTASPQSPADCHLQVVATWDGTLLLAVLCVSTEEEKF
jgi:hypothetical protein